MMGHTLPMMRVAECARVRPLRAGIRCLSRSSDFVVAGGGVVGISIARELKRRYANASVCVLEKENDCGMHASGRNSGVLHAGFYYTADSLKAKLTRQGCKEMREFCRERGLDLLECGKLVVAATEADLEGLDELKRRGDVNGVELDMVSEAEARELEPKARTVSRAIWSPTTAAANPRQVMQALVREAVEAGVEVKTGVAVRDVRQGVGASTSSAVDSVELSTDSGPVSAGYFVNAAGLYADRLAHMCDVAKHLKILPFKGLYLYAKPHVRLSRHVYPVPNIDHPFLGVHWTVTADGACKIGPTAIPALWREQYRGLERFSADEAFEVAALQGSLLLSGAAFDFRSLAAAEIRKYSRETFVRDAAWLVPGVKPGDFSHWGPAGIRAQLVDTRSRALVMDFCVESSRRSTHILNAVSPAWTCSRPFARLVCDKIEENVRSGAQ